MKTSSKRWEVLQNVSFVSSFVPRRCGIGTFTNDLAEAVAQCDPAINARVVAMNDRPEGYRYPARVWFEINRNRLGEYRLAADYLNMSHVDVMCLQHEFGLFGGKEGQHIIDLLKRVRMPVVSTLHTVLKEPNPAQLTVTKQLGEYSDRMVVMAERAVEFLTDIYGIDKGKITLIPHGIPDVPFVDPNFYKDQFGVEGRRVILTFGLIGPSKGIENMIEALPQIVENHPDAVYIVLGATHPGVLAEQGEDYRLGLQRRAKELGVADHIQWVNKFVELDELKEYLGAADIYVTPYLNPAQITSGTLAYALGFGKATVSTPYWHAEEMLADGRGRLVEFGNHQALADAICELLDNETERHAVRKRAYQYTRAMRWEAVAEQYLDLFAEICQERARHPRPLQAPATRADKRSELPEINIDHMFSLTDETGIIHKSRATVADRRSGYDLTDNAHALIVALFVQDHIEQKPAMRNLDDLIGRYIAFLLHAYDEESGRFHSQLTFDGRWEEATPSEDDHGRVLWALGEVVARSETRGYVSLATELFHQALPACENFVYPHGWAYSLIGMHSYLRRFSGDSQTRRVRELLAQRMFEAFQQNAGDDWWWCSNKITYATARIPHALLLSGRWMFNNDMIEMALKSLDWLDKVLTGPNGEFSPVGTDGWWPRGEERARFAQKPIEAAAAIEASLEAYRVTNDDKWLDRAHRCLGWFLGDNDLHLPLYDPTTGGCTDALLAHGLDENQSAQSTLAWLLSLLSLYDYALDVDTGRDATRQPPVPKPDDEPDDEHLASKQQSSDDDAQEAEEPAEQKA